MFNINNIKLHLDPAAIMAQAKKEHDAAKALFDNDSRFIGSSLGAWLAEAKRAGVEHVPAKEIFTISRDVFLSQENMSATDAAIWKDLQAVTDQVPFGYMIRWDPCAPLSLKEYMAHGKPFSDSPEFDMSDPRAFDIVMEYPADRIPVWSRPWVHAEFEGYYPIEFRVFVRDNKIAGIANYYVQRPLPNNPKIQGYVRACAEAAEQLIQSMIEHKRQPWMPNYTDLFDYDKIHATLDFLICKKTGNAIFLEAGPPFGAGAHPCAFLGTRNINGIALGMNSKSTERN